MNIFLFLGMLFCYFKITFMPEFLYQITFSIIFLKSFFHYLQGPTSLLSLSTASQMSIFPRIQEPLKG